MALTLKGTGVAANLVACLGVDDDDTTVKDFVSGNTITHNASITAPVVGTATWKGNTIGWFKTDQGADAFSPRGVTWTGTKPVVNSGSSSSGWGLLVIVNSLVDATGGFFLEIDSESHSIKRDGSGKLVVRQASTDQTASTTSIGASTKLAFGCNVLYGGTNSYYYGLESGSIAADGTYTDAGFGTDGLNLDLWGGVAGNGVGRGNYHFVCLKNAPFTLTEVQNIFADPRGELFTGGGGGGSPVGPLIGGKLIGRGILGGRL